MSTTAVFQHPAPGGAMTIHELCLQALNSACPGCGVPPGCPCACESAHYHLARVAAAAHAGHVPVAEFASVIHDADVFTGMDTLADPGGPS